MYQNNLGFCSHTSSISVLFSQSLRNATDRSYGYSYIIGWVGMFLAALTATFYSIAGCYIGGERYDDKVSLSSWTPTSSCFHFPALSLLFCEIIFSIIHLYRYKRTKSLSSRINLLFLGLLHYHFLLSEF